MWALGTFGLLFQFGTVAIPDPDAQLSMSTNYVVRETTPEAVSKGPPFQIVIEPGETFRDPDHGFSNVMHDYLESLMGSAGYKCTWNKDAGSRLKMHVEIVGRIFRVNIFEDRKGERSTSPRYPAVDLQATITLESPKTTLKRKVALSYSEITRQVVVKKTASAIEYRISYKDTLAWMPADAPFFKAVETSDFLQTVGELLATAEGPERLANVLRRNPTTGAEPWPPCTSKPANELPRSIAYARISALRGLAARQRPELAKLMDPNSLSPIELGESLGIPAVCSLIRHQPDVSDECAKLTALSSIEVCSRKRIGNALLAIPMALSLASQFADDTSPRVRALAVRVLSSAAKSERAKDRKAALMVALKQFEKMEGTETDATVLADIKKARSDLQVHLEVQRLLPSVPQSGSK